MVRIDALGRYEQMYFLFFSLHMSIDKTLETLCIQNRSCASHCVCVYRYFGTTKKIAEENLCKWKTRRVLEFILKRYKYRRYKQNVEFLVFCLNDVINCMFSSIFFHIEPKARVSIYPKIEFRFPFELKRIYEIEGEFSLQIDFRIHRMWGVYVRRHAAACDRPIYEWIPPRIDTRVCYWKAKTNQKSWCRDRVSIHRRKKTRFVN